MGAQLNKNERGPKDPEDPYEPFSRRVFRAGMWAFALRFASGCLGLVRTIVLARLLFPEDFGLFGVATLSLMTLQTFSVTGIDAALIHRKDVDRSYLDTAWTVSALRGTVLFVILFLCAPLVAGFFNAQHATWVIRIMAVSTLLTGLANNGVLFFQKELQFNRQFVYELSGTLAEVTVGISLALLFGNVWALVWSSLALRSVLLVMSFLLHPFRPRFRFERTKFLELFTFGKWMLGTAILTFLITQGDDILVGKMVGVAALGLYQMAYMLSNLPNTEITMVISRVAFPTYSILQDDLPGLKDAYLKILGVTALVSIPAAGGIFILAGDFTKLFLGEKWTPMVSAMQILAVYGGVQSINDSHRTLFQGAGVPRYGVISNCIRIAFMGLLIYPLTARWGITGAAAATTIPGLLIQPYNISRLCRIIVASFKSDFLVAVGPPLLCACAMMAAVYAFRSIVAMNVYVFFLTVVFGGITYLVGIVIVSALLGRYNPIRDLIHIARRG